MLTDCAFWFIIVPFLTIKDYNINLVSTLSFYIYCLMDIISNFDLKNKLYCILINWYVAVDHKYAYHQCCFSARRYSFKLLGEFVYLIIITTLNCTPWILTVANSLSSSAFSLVSNRILLPMDSYICHFSMDCSCYS